MTVRHSVFVAVFGVLASVATWAARPFALNPDNPRHFLFRDRPTLLITSGEHYGALVDRGFDYEKYFATLAADGLNGTRVFMAYRERPGAFNIAANSLAPSAERFLAPWKRSDQPGYLDGGNKFDLTQWDDAYFARLKALMRAAGARGIIVEANLFSSFYSENSWSTHPFNARNNVNGLRPLKWDQALTRQDAELLKFQEAYIRKLVSELQEFDNVYFEICNEPYAGGVDMTWHSWVADVLASALKPGAAQTAANLSATHPTTHLVSWNVSNASSKVVDPHPAIAVFNFHYASPPDAVAVNWALNRPIGDNETGFRGTNDAPYRMEAWDFLMAGGALFNHLDYSFIPGREDGTHVMTDSTPGGGNPGLRRSFAAAREFLHSLPWPRMKPDAAVVVGGVPGNYSARALSLPGEAYGIYLRPLGMMGQFAARWEGTLEAAESGEFALHTLSNDGVRLWVRDAMIIDNWTDHPATEDTGRVRLEAGRPVPIRLEYFYAGGDGVTKLSWTRPNGSREVIPSQVLKAKTGESGLSATYFSDRSLGDHVILFRRVEPSVDFAWGKDGLKFPSAGDRRVWAPELELPAGRYHAEWINPINGAVMAEEILDHPGGRRALAMSAGAPDMALRIRRRQ
jgi:hypothetical protein